MAYYHPCKGCTVDTATCKRRIKMKRAISGLCVTSVKFKCPEREPIFKIGQRVATEIPFTDEFYDEYDITFHGTIVDEPKYGVFIARIDDGPSAGSDDYTCPESLQGDGFAKRTSSRFSPIDESPRSVCSQCSESANGWRCCDVVRSFESVDLEDIFGSGDGPTVPKCQKQIEAGDQ